MTTPENKPYEIFLTKVPPHLQSIEEIKTRYEGVDYLVGHYKDPDGFHYYFIPSQVSTPAGWLMLIGMTDEQNQEALSQLDGMLPVAIKYTLRWERDHVLAQKLFH